MLASNRENDLPPARRATCPSCGARTTFSYRGIQRWPEKVAERLGILIEQEIWECDNCHSSMLQESLQDVEDNNEHPPDSD